MSDYFYRFRSTKALLDGFHELENQEIFFSPLHRLNDPMEGFKDVFWLGDDIVWRNLFKHYILCLLNTTSLVIVMRTEFDKNLLKDVALAVPDNLPNASIRIAHQRACDKFLSWRAVNNLVALLVARKPPVRREEITSYIRSLHLLALDAVLTEVAELGALTARVSGAIGAQLDIRAERLVEIDKELADFFETLPPNSNKGHLYTCLT